ncbi:MAG: class I SAM-dependent methyltransferase [Polyangiaceae bacterium]
MALTSLEDFTPHDTIPWAELAEGLLAFRTEDGFFGLRPRRYAEHVVDWMLTALSANSALDLGSGPGLFALALAERGVAVTGVDIAAPLVDFATRAATERALPAIFHTRSLLDLDSAPELAGPYDLVLLVNSIVNHLSEAELLALFRGIRKRLSPRGRFLCELVLSPGELRTADNRVTEHLLELPSSPWFAGPHTWLRRELLFTDAAERVTHHVITPSSPGAEPRHYWSRFKCHRTEYVDAVLRQAGLEPLAWYGPELGAPLPSPEDPDQRGFVWVERR